MSTGVNIPITADASPLVRECNKATAALNSMGGTADKAGAKVEAGFKVSGGSVQKAIGAFGQIGGVLGKLSPAVGSAASSMTGLTSGFSGLAAAGAEAGISTGAMVAATAAATAGVAALALVVVGAGAAIYKMGETLVTSGFKANDALAALEGFKKIGSDFYPEVPEESLKSFDLLAGSGKALTDIMSKFTVLVGSNTGPVIAQITATVMGLALTALDMFGVWAEGKNLLVEFAKFVTNVFLVSFWPVTLAVLALGNAFIGLADLIGVEVSPGLREAMSGVDGLTEGLVGLGVEGFGAAGAALSDYTKKGAAFIAQSGKAAKATEDEGKAAKAAADALKELLAAKKALDDITQSSSVATMDAVERENEAYRQRALTIEKNLVAGLKALDELKAGEADYKALKDDADEASAASAEELRVNVKAIEDKAAKDKADALEDHLKKQEAFEDSLLGITRAASLKHASDMEKEVDAYKQQLEAIAELEAAGLEEAGDNADERTRVLQDAADARLAVEAAHLGNVKDINEASAKEQKEATMAVVEFAVEQATKALQAVSASFEKSYEAANATANQLTDQLIAGDQVYTKAQKTELGKRIAEQRKNAKEAFAIAKAARIAEAAITTAMAVISAYATGVAYPIVGAVLGPAMAIAAGVAGAISIAAIASEQPSFHSGKSPDEMQATILKSEAVLNPTAAARMGRGRIEDMNNGRMGGNGGGGPAPIVLGHRVFEAGLKRSLDSAGVLREALHAGSVYGHRSNRRLSSV